MEPSAPSARSVLNATSTYELANFALTGFSVANAMLSEPVLMVPLSVKATGLLLQIDVMGRPDAPRASQGSAGDPHGGTRVIAEQAVAHGVPPGLVRGHQHAAHRHGEIAGEVFPRGTARMLGEPARHVGRQLLGHALR